MGSTAALAALLTHLLAATPTDNGPPPQPEGAVAAETAPAAQYPELPIPAVEPSAAPSTLAAPAPALNTVPLSTLQVEDTGGHVLFVLPDAPVGMSLVVPPNKYKVRRGDPATGEWGPAKGVEAQGWPAGRRAGGGLDAGRPRRGAHRTQGEPDDAAGAHAGAEGRPGPGRYG
ncbi:MAG: hypothetical protein QM765_26510 [Myxococcales bacterium]